MEIIKCLVLLLFVVLRVGDINCKCTLSLAHDFSKSSSPVYLQDGVFLAPNSMNVTVKYRGSLTVACPGDKRYVVIGNDTTNVQVVEAYCIANNTFRIGRWDGPFKDLRCNGAPWFSSEDSGPCDGGGRVYKIGYKIESKLHVLYEACFDKDLIRTLYVKHHISRANKFFQGGARPQFIEGGLFGKVQMSQLYKNEKQKSRLNELLGENMDDKYITKKQFLTRGHLAARADFSLLAEQRATFHYVNTAPQWMRGNAGDWAALEDAVRRRAFTLNRTLTIYTGTMDVLTLEDKNGQFREIYLQSDENNNPIVPVPMYFFKLVYDQTRRTATAFVTINSSFFTDEVNDQLTFCNNICDGNPNFKWLSWREDGTHSFCCDYEEFAKKVKFLPPLDVQEQFY